ncbi:MAG TPA: hypothetical protein VED63_02795 [Acidimicrobiales bacterium]|nr:hypothetical protein [Acidimicrobiales bacterium]
MSRIFQTGFTTSKGGDYFDARDRRDPDLPILTLTDAPWHATMPET